MHGEETEPKHKHVGTIVHVSNCGCTRPPIEINMYMIYIQYENLKMNKGWNKKEVMKGIFLLKSVCNKTK